MKKKQSTERTIRTDFIEALRCWQPFNSLPDSVQREMAYMIWCDSTKVRAHKGVAGASSYRYQELARRFGRGKFRIFNQRAKVFSLGPWSKAGGQTRAFKLNPVYSKIKATYLHQVVLEKRTSRVVDMNERQVRTKPRAIASKRRDGTTVKLWADVVLRPAVPVNIPLIVAAYEKLDAEIQRHTLERCSDGLANTRVQRPQLDALTRKREALAMLFAHAYTDLGGGTELPMRYRETNSGRLYANGFSLQTCPRDVRLTALHGCWDYDISNCHFTLLAQLADAQGFRCPAIDHYLANKNAVRHAIATDLNTTVEVAKECLLALVYGAPLSRSVYTTFGKTLGKAGAAQLLALPLFQELAHEVTQARSHLIQQWPVRNRALVNHAGCGLPMTAAPAVKLAHLLQGAEALILKTAIVHLEARQPGNTLLLQHDGFSVQHEIDVVDLNAHIKLSTGFEIAFVAAPVVSPIPT